MFYLKFFFSANQMEKVCETIFNGPFIKSLQTYNSFDPKFLSAQFVCPCFSLSSKFVERLMKELLFKLNKT